MASTKPPPDNHPDPNAQHDWFYMWIGLCLTRWGFVHEAMYRLCHITLRTSEKGAAIVFYKSPSFETRLSLTNELIESLFQPLKPGEHETGVIKEWHDVQKELRRLSPVRNVLAHQQPRSMGEATVIMGAIKIGGGQAPGRIVHEKSWLEVRLAHSEAIRGRKPEVEYVRDTELPDHYKAVEQVLSRLHKLSGSLSAHLAQQQGPVLSEPGHMPSP